MKHSGFGIRGGFSWDFPSQEKILIPGILNLMGFLQKSLGSRSRKSPGLKKNHKKLRESESYRDRDTKYERLFTTNFSKQKNQVTLMFRICRRYQQCTSCVAMDEAGKTINNGNGPEECNWESGRYEISFVQGQIRVDCENNKTKCGVNLCKVRNTFKLI